MQNTAPIVVVTPTIVQASNPVATYGIGGGSTLAVVLDEETAAWVDSFNDPGFTDWERENCRVGDFTVDAKTADVKLPKNAKVVQTGPSKWQLLKFVGKTIITPKLVLGAYDWVGPGTPHGLALLGTAMAVNPGLIKPTAIISAKEAVHVLIHGDEPEDDEEEE